MAILFFLLFSSYAHAFAQLVPSTAASSSRTVLMPSMWAQQHPTLPIVVSMSALRHSTLYGTPGNNDDDDDDDDDDFNSNNKFDLDLARQRLEKLISTTIDAGSEGSSRPQQYHRQQQQQQQQQQPPPPPQFQSWSTTTTPVEFFQFNADDCTFTSLPPVPPPRLTTMDRERRLAELQLLQQLQYGDDAQADLWNLWLHERGPAAAALLQQVVEEWTGAPEDWPRAEQVLRRLLQEHGIYWVEPIFRLATLCYLQGRYAEAEHLCTIVLAVKPWHIGALSGIVKIYAAQHQPEKARQWAAKRLPAVSPNGNNKRRISWVQEAVTQARDAFSQQKEKLQALFGAPDEHVAVRYEMNVWQ